MQIKVYEYCIEQLRKDNILKPEDYFLLGCIVGDRGVARLTKVLTIITNLRDIQRNLNMAEVEIEKARMMVLQGNYIDVSIWQ